MPWTAKDARRHTKKADTPARQKTWARVANDVLSRTGDEARAAKMANGVIKRLGAHKAKRKP